MGKATYDPIAKKAVAMCLARAEARNLGDVKTLGDGLSEMRIAHDGLQGGEG